MAASYPTSAKIFTSRNAGDIVQPAHVNDLQDEVNAIESGLLNGIAHPFSPDGDVTRVLGTSAKRWLQPSGTAAAPGVAIGATGVGAYSSGANALDFATAGIKALGIDATQFIDSPTQPRCSITHSTTQSINNATETAVLFDTDQFDVGAMHDTVSNTSRITIPTGGDGLYLLMGRVVFDANGTGQRYIFLKKNGVTNVPGSLVKSNFNAATYSQSLQVVMLISLVANDYIEVFAAQDSGISLNIGNATSAVNNSAFAVKLW